MALSRLWVDNTGTLRRFLQLSRSWRDPGNPVSSARDADDAAPEAKVAQSLGFQPQQRDGLLRKEAVVGSRFKNKRCVSKDNFADIVQRSLNDQRKVETIRRQRIGSGCAGDYYGSSGSSGS